MNGPITTEETCHVSNILEHYAHAKEKHPYFCDLVLWDDEPSFTAGSLRVARARLKVAIKSNSVSAINDLLDCELREFSDALANGDKAQAVEELYDAIAVLLRTIDVIEGRQKLGKLES